MNLFRKNARRCGWTVACCLALLLSVANTRGQIQIQDGNPLTCTHATGTSINQPFTVTTGANVLVVILADKGVSLPEPATLAWHGQTLVRDVQTAYTSANGYPRSVAIYHLFNPVAGTANISGTLATGVSDTWVTACSLNGADTAVAPLIGGANSGSSSMGLANLDINLSGVASGSWAAVGSEFANLGLVAITGTGGAATLAADVNDATTTVTAGYVAGLSAGVVNLAEGFDPNPGVGPQKSNFAVAVFSPPVPHPVNPLAVFGIKFLGNTTDYLTGSAGVVPVPGWNNLADATFTSGIIRSSDGSVSVTLNRSGPGAANTWNSGAIPDSGNSSLMDGYQDAGQNAPATNVLSRLTAPAYDVYLYTGGDVARPSSGTDWLPNYTVNGTVWYAATLKGYDAILKAIPAVPTTQNTNTYPTNLTAGTYLKISHVVPVSGAITISANSDNLTYRSPLNGIEIVALGNAPQIMSQPAPHRFYTGGVAQFSVQAEGVGPLAYQWRQNGVNLNDGGNISGSQTASLTISNLALTAAGNYDVEITNSYGSVTSLVANLNVVVETQADASFEAWLAAYLVTTNASQTYIVNNLTDRNFSFMWQQAYMIWMTEDTYNRTQSPDQKQLINNLLNTFTWQNMSDLTWDGWDDDLEWGIIALVRGYQITGNVAALNSAVFNWDAVMNRGWDTVFGGGIWETTAKDYTSSKVVLCNCPQIIAGMTLYQITGQTNYFTTCESIYAWVRANMFVATPAQATNGMNQGQVNEGVQYANTNNTGEELKPSNNSYNSGLFAMAASTLYQVTGGTQYLADAILAANQKINNEPIANEDHVANGDFGAEQLIRGVVLIASQNQDNLWPAYWPWLQVQCTAAWDERRNDLNLTHNDWTTATPTGTNNLDSMESECAVLVQQISPTNIPGFVNCTNKLSGSIIGSSGSWENEGNTIAKAFDGNLSTFFDGPDASGDWVGLNFGTGAGNVIGQINYWPRIGFASRMLGGTFQGDHTANFSTPVTLFSITTVPSDNGSVSSAPITNQTAFQFVRYVGPANANCDVAELQFLSPNPPPPPIFLTNSWNGSQLMLNWPTGGLLLQATNLAGPWTTNAIAMPPFLITPTNQPQVFYRAIVP